MHNATFFKLFSFLILYCCLSHTYAAAFLDRLNSSTPSSTTQDSFVPADQAFHLMAKVLDSKEIELTWMIQPGYYLYKKEIHINSANAELGAYQLPEGIAKQDEWLGAYEVYQTKLQIRLPIKKVSSSPIELTIRYQGCAENDYCYPPISKSIQLAVNDSSQAPVAPVEASPAPPPTQALPISEQEHITRVLAQQNEWEILLLFYGFGLLLAFTPCVLPMLPILTSIIAGEGKALTKLRAFSLASAYVVAMASTYAIAGMIAGKLGGNLQAVFQAPWLLTLFSGLFVLLALSLFGFFNVQLPQSISNRLNALNNRQKGGTWIGVIIMGALSALVVSPCITPPLVGALAYISQTGDASLGGYSLFIMGLGMGTPLIAAATLEGYLMPKTGPWMNVVKDVFGVMLLGLAISMLERFMQSPLTLAMWSVLFIVSGVMLGALTSVRRYGLPRFWKGLGIALLGYGFILLVGVGLGNDRLLEPLRNQDPQNSKYSTPLATPSNGKIAIQNITDLEKELKIAQQKGQYTMVEFTAKWCISCQVMKNTTFRDPGVLTKLKSVRWLQADVTANDSLDQQLMQQLGVFAPPSFVFFDPSGQELRHAHLVGEKSASAFLKALDSLGIP